MEARGFGSAPLQNRGHRASNRARADPSSCEEPDGDFSGNLDSDRDSFQEALAATMLLRAPAGAAIFRACKPTHFRLAAFFSHDADGFFPR
jgi:hypothetical protein